MYTRYSENRSTRASSSHVSCKNPFILRLSQRYCVLIREVSLLRGTCAWVTVSQQNHNRSNQNLVISSPSTHTHTYAYIYVHVHVYIYVHVHVYMYMYMYICTCTCYGMHGLGWEYCLNMEVLGSVPKHGALSWRLPYLTRHWHVPVTQL